MFYNDVFLGKAKLVVTPSDSPKFHSYVLTINTHHKLYHYTCTFQFEMVLAM